MSAHTPEPWKFDDLEFKIKGTGYLNGSKVIANVGPAMDFASGKNTQIANAERIVECVNAMDGIHEPIEFMDCVLDTLQKVKTMMDGTITQNLREAIYDDVTATIDDLQRNKNLPTP